MDDDHVNDLPLNDRFVKCQQFVDSLDHSAAAATDETRVRTTCDALEYLTRQVATLSLFSANEHYAELNPAHIQYLLLPAYLGRLATLENDPSKRVHALEAAAIYYKDFLTRVHSYGIINTPLPWAATDGDEGAENARLNVPRDPALARQAKIDAYKRSCELQAQLKTMRVASGTSNSDDDDVVRERNVALVQYWACIAVRELTDIDNELPMARRMAAERSSGVSDAQPAPSTSANHTSLRPILLTRDSVQKRVLGAGYPSLPVLTVDEWYSGMVRDGYFPDASAPPAASRAPVARAEVVLDDSGEEHARRQLIAQDDYKDTHRTGWGNRHNKG